MRVVWGGAPCVWRPSTIKAAPAEQGREGVVVPRGQDGTVIKITRKARNGYIERVFDVPTGTDIGEVKGLLTPEMLSELGVKAANLSRYVVATGSDTEGFRPASSLHDQPLILLAKSSMTKARASTVAAEASSGAPQAKRARRPVAAPRESPAPGTPAPGTPASAVRASGGRKPEPLPEWYHAGILSIPPEHVLEALKTQDRLRKRIDRAGTEPNPEDLAAYEDIRRCTSRAAATEGGHQALVAAANSRASELNRLLGAAVTVAARLQVATALAARTMPASLQPPEGLH